ncbi:outer membrane protein [Methylobrevis pamukkalensis]|nr:outer membrane protein [Methylobrevis pamukkalensis]
MRNLLLAGTAAALLLGSASLASAADIAEPIPAAPEAPMEAAIFDWTGIYAGANIGYGFGGEDVIGTRPPGLGVGTAEISGVFGGLQVGYNYQMGSAVVGIEADLQLADIEDDVSNGTVSGTATVDWFGTVRPRVGFAYDRTLFYGTGGLAYGHYEYEGSAFGTSAGADDTYVGWTVGAGVEHSFTDNLSAKVEYLYVDLGNKDVSILGVETTPSPNFHSVRLGLNYRF